MHFFQINSKDVSSEYFENEVLAINLKTGNYYSLRFSAFAFWKLLNEGNSFESTLQLLCTHYNQDTTVIDSIFRNLLEQLINNELIEDSSIKNITPDNNWLSTLPIEYSEPQLECYTDMQDLLLFDPIHEVDTNVGWPKKSEEESKD